MSDALWYALIAALANVCGALILSRGATRGVRVIEHSVAFGAGFMLAVAITDILPEAFARSGPAAPGLVLVGYLAVHLTQHTVTPHFHFGEETHAVHPLAGTSALVGLLLHTFFDGVAIASAFIVSPALGTMVFLAILLHKFPEGLTIASLMMAAGRSARAAVASAGLLGIATVVGVVVTDEVGFLVRHGLALSAGVTIYVAASNLVPEFQGEEGVETPGGIFRGSARVLPRAPGARPIGVTEPTLFRRSQEPLAARMRPTTLEEVVGQDHLLGPGKALGDAIRRGDLGSCIFWGPPGSGKTTLARIIARYTARHFEPFSAVTEGVARVREIIKAAEERLQYEGRGTILFCDEIHRFNRGQQDAFLPWVENGVVALIGATTENPSFELTGALLSRCRVFVLEPLTEADVRSVVQRALADAERGLGALQLGIDDDALALLAREADGDARRALQALEAAAEYVIGKGEEGSGKRGATAARPLDRLTAAVIADALQRRLAKSDKSGDEHYNLISALHKAVRGSDVEGTLYWLARMLAGGQDPLYIARRLVRIASEDVGLADPRALMVVLAAKDAYHFLGTPEGELALAEAAVYLATAPKSNRVYEAMGRATEAAREHPAEGVPLHLRNAPTGLMRDLGYGAEYKYAHAYDEAYAPQDYLPEPLRGARWYVPTESGYEKTVKERLEWWAGLRKKAAE